MLGRSSFLTHACVMKVIDTIGIFFALKSFMVQGYVEALRAQPFLRDSLKVMDDNVRGIPYY